LVLGGFCLERGGGSILAHLEEEEEALEELENRNARVNAQFEREQAKLARMMGVPPPTGKRFVKRRR